MLGLEESPDTAVRRLAMVGLKGNAPGNARGSGLRGLGHGQCHRK